MVKYVLKTDPKHNEFMPKIYCSNGIGSGYWLRKDAKRNAYRSRGFTYELYKLKDGREVALPIYYRNNIYSEDERELLWLEKLDREVRYVLGIEVDISNGEEVYYKVLEDAQRKNKRLGYGDDTKNFEQEMYERQRRNFLYKERLDRHFAKYDK